MNKVLSAALLAILAIPSAFAANRTWTGTISDSMCGAKHNMAGMDDRECVEMCVKGRGKYVFVSQGEVYAIANQDNKDLATHASHTVILTGELKGDTITVSKVEMPKGSKS